MAFLFLSSVLAEHKPLQEGQHFLVAGSYSVAYYFRNA